jgi:predicted metal-binding membrane protein
MASTRTAAAATALTATLGLAAASWVVGSSIGLMLMLVALGAMSVNSMSVIASLVLAQKLLQPRAAIDVPLALVIVGLGILINDRKEKR